MVDIGNNYGLATSALVTRMDDVLGRAVGNAVEVEEALEVLAGSGPPDVIEITLALAKEMLSLAEIDADPGAVLASGAALETFEVMVAAQGGDLAAGLPEATERRVLLAASSGFVHGIEARSIGMAAWRLGAGRARKEDSVSMTAGIICLVKPGDRVTSGQPIFELRCDDKDRFDTAEELVENAIDIGVGAKEILPLVVERIGR